jgi:TrmH family RNA methyltransferase
MITSTGNPQIKKLNALLKKAKERRTERLFVVEGPKMCFEAPRDWVRAVYVSESFAADPDTREQLISYCTSGCGGDFGAAISYEIVSDSVLKSVSDTQNPQGIMAVIKMPEYTISDMMCGERTLLLVLEGVQDPGNLGTMLRTGEGAGVTGVIMSRTTVDLFNPKTIRSTMGSLYRVPFVIVDDLEGTIRQLKADGVKLYAAHLMGRLSYDEPDYTGACGFLIGNEGNGLSREVADAADIYIRIPMEGQVESLNAAISAGLLMYECSRQRRHK